MARAARELHEHTHAAARLEPARAEGSHRGKVHGAPMNLAALHGKEHGATVRIAAHDLGVEPDGVAQDHRDVTAWRTFGAAREYKRRPARSSRLCDGGRGRIGPHDEDVGVVDEARG